MAVCLLAAKNAVSELLHKKMSELPRKIVIVFFCFWITDPRQQRLAFMMAERCTDITDWGERSHCPKGVSQTSGCIRDHNENVAVRSHYLTNKRTRALEKALNDLRGLQKSRENIRGFMGSPEADIIDHAV